MISKTIYTTECVWGSSSFNKTDNLKVGKTGSTSSDGTKYRGRLTFAALPVGHISKITLKQYRTDTSAKHTLKFGGSTSADFGATLGFSVNAAVSKGKGSKSIDLTAYAETIRGFGGEWYLHIRHGSGTNSNTQFNGDEAAEDIRPQLVVEIDGGTVYCNVNGGWIQCHIYYYNNGGWIQCIPYYRRDGTWTQI